MKKMISHEELSSFCMELSLLFHAGVGAGDALALLREDSDKSYGDLLSGMARQVDEGAALSAALRASGCFPVYVSGLVEVGEQAGRLEEALSALSRYYEYRTRLDRQIRSALLYPAIMLLLMLLVIAVLLIKVLPMFDDVYQSLGGRLTGVAGFRPDAGSDAACVVDCFAVIGGGFCVFCRSAVFSERGIVLVAWNLGRQRHFSTDEYCTAGTGAFHGNDQRHVH